MDSYRKTQNHHAVVSKVDPSSHANYQYLTTTKVHAPLRLMHQNNQHLARQLVNIRKKLEVAICEKSVSLNSNLAVRGFS